MAWSQVGGAEWQWVDSELDDPAVAAAGTGSRGSGSSAKRGNGGGSSNIGGTKRPRTSPARSCHGHGHTLHPQQGSAADPGAPDIVVFARPVGAVENRIGWAPAPGISDHDTVLRQFGQLLARERSEMEMAREHSMGEEGYDRFYPAPPWEKNPRFGRTSVAGRLASDVLRLKEATEAYRLDGVALGDHAAQEALAAISDYALQLAGFIPSPDASR